jgi:hypothetical protein
MKYLAGLIGLIGVALIAYLILGKPITVTVPEDKVRTEVAAKLPMVVKKMGITANITQLEIDFLESDEVFVDIAMDLEGFGLSGFATGTATSGLRYDSGDFFLEDLDLDDLSITATKDSASTITKAATTAESLWNRFKSDKMDDDPEAAVAIEDLKAKALERMIPAARDIADNALKTTPVYSLNNQDMKMDLAALALVDVRFQAEAVEADLDPRNVILWFLGVACMVVMCMILGLGIVLGGGSGVGGLFG